jgi:hypothetical protein
MVGYCAGFFEDADGYWSAPATLAEGTLCTLKVKVEAAGTPLPNFPLGLVIEDSFGPFGQPCTTVLAKKASTGPRGEEAIFNIVFSKKVNFYIGPTAPSAIYAAVPLWLSLKAQDPTVNNTCDNPEH